MTSLSVLQARFQSYLLGRNGDIEALTVGSDRLPARDRLAVYADAYRLRLLEVLAEDFPGLHGMIGDQSFEALGTAYIDANPSDHPSVRWYGRRLPGFLRSTDPYREQPLLAEMAEFEWAQGEVLDAADSPVVELDTLGALAPAAWPDMHISFQSALRRLDLAWNVPALWQAVHDGTDAPPEPRHLEAAVPWLLWRRDLKVHWRSLEDDERWAIDAVRGGCSFGELCEGLLARTGDADVPLRAAGYLKRWVTDELVARIQYQQ
ncbi:MAG: DNA-binding domain-containing protein [Gammaproteobacteria bacterium]|nr:DNA-binding domain-containing protein [Gammaproteobacteria bacterium]